jgi:hypothetical protein
MHELLALHEEDGDVSLGGRGGDRGDRDERGADQKQSRYSGDRQAWAATRTDAS